MLTAPGNVFVGPWSALLVAKQVVFIGSSSEGLNLARTLLNQLREDRRLKKIEFKLWTEAFEAMHSPASVLTDLLTTVSLAILVFTADDMTQKRGQKLNSVRDNLLFEFGLFWGKLGLALSRTITAF
jgi:predicted nucleotide-binding protein